MCSASISNGQYEPTRYQPVLLNTRDRLLDTVHGADYFKRWHADKENSGGVRVLVSFLPLDSS
jgi:hypothetical protein